MASKKVEDKTFDGVLVWRADSSPASPLCVVHQDDMGLSVELYDSTNDGVIGGIVRTVAGDLVARFGWLPVEALD